MKRFAKIVTAAAMTVGACAVAVPAQAATAVPQSTHRGTAGCFNWSWADGTTTTTIYYHNTCGKSADLCVWWRDGKFDDLHRITAGAGVHGHRKETGAISSIEDC
ncbi:hypothetical protein [Peterkaempfera sp. SMS 1(5)a]|uniref:hypothetical protein n=1 Tax=Peterkaempfera podocarpi TaxID=3232308 RepID=UPI00366EA1BA